MEKYYPILFYLILILVAIRVLQSSLIGRIIHFIVYAALAAIGLYIVYALFIA